MATPILPTPALKKIHQCYLQRDFNKTRAAQKLHISRNTLKRYLQLIAIIEKNHPEQISDAAFCLEQLKNHKQSPVQLTQLKTVLPDLLTGQIQTARSLWQIYFDQYPGGYRYSQFAYHYASWHQSHNIRRYPQITKLTIAPADQEILNSWRRSADRRKWELAVVLLDNAIGVQVNDLARKVERTPEKIREWLNAYCTGGLAGLQKKPYRVKPEVSRLITQKKENLMRLLHEPPELHGFNRTSWRLADLSAAFQQNYGMPLSIATVSEYIRQAGYVFRRARKTLTSPDPEFRQKLERITTILSSLGTKEKFFSVDEYGPFSVKIKGGRSRVRRGESKTFPQHQKSKGFLICTAALELSTNQMTHFYSVKKDTAEMIKLIELLLVKYRGEDKLYFSWDAAAWHASKKLYAFLEIVNAGNYRNQHVTPLVELAPLPASAQFLNVIESVFSGLARAVIHNSDYASVLHCKAAIDRYFKERNAHFLQHPKRAGNKIWGKERVVAEFRDHHNCKDPNWR